jgi:ribonuclease P protein component
MLKYQTVESLDFVAKMGVTISIKKAKSAVDRNFYKRILKEAYRLQKSTLIYNLEANQKFLICFFVYLQVPPKKAAYNLIFEETKELLDKLNLKICSTK